MSESENGTANWVRWALYILVMLVIGMASTGMVSLSGKASEDKVEAIQSARMTAWIDYERRHAMIRECLAEIKTKIEVMQRDITEIKAIIRGRKK